MQIRSKHVGGVGYDFVDTVLNPTGGSGSAKDGGNDVAL
jgi:hypothetical protein